MGNGNHAAESPESRYVELAHERVDRLYERFGYFKATIELRLQTHMGKVEDYQRRIALATDEIANDFRQFKDRIAAAAPAGTLTPEQDQEFERQIARLEALGTETVVDGVAQFPVDPNAPVTDGRAVDGMPDPNAPQNAGRSSGTGGNAGGSGGDAGSSSGSDS